MNSGEPLEAAEQAASVCAPGPTVKGIDVTYHQQAIDWAKVKAAGIEFAFIRVSDGSTFQDPMFETNWAAARAAGVRRGAYQLFRPAEDARAQADLLLSKLGNKLEPGDLPPVLDAVVTGSLPPAQIQANMQIWVDRVNEMTGRAPIIHTSRTWWTTNGSAAFASSPLWATDISTMACPNIADAWPMWTFWQHSWTGRIDGITVDVDLNLYNGDLPSLEAFAGVEPFDACGNGECATDESAVSCPEDCTAGVIPAEGAVIDDGDPRFEIGGALTRETTAGNGGDLMWALTNAGKMETNFGRWHLELQKSGRYHIEVYTDTAYAQSKHAKYIVRSNGGTRGRIIDQTALDGWQSLGEHNFAAGADQWVHAGDNTGDKNMRLAFDAIRLTRVGEITDDDDNDDADSPGGCAAAGGANSAICLLAIGGLLRSRRRRRK
jgi:GH25 family lysozyme M1 (1,4-beta-N-acetylmuramidase)